MHKPLRLLLLLTLGALTALLAPAVLVLDPVLAMLAALASLASYLLACELVFRAVYRLRTGSLPERFRSIPFDQLHVEPHPFMPFAYKADFAPRVALRKDRTANYPLHAGRFQFVQPCFDEHRLMNGLDSPTIATPKPEGRMRILCLGASTTGNHIEEDGRVYSYPLELGRELRKRYPDMDLEVVNGGVGGRTSAEVLIHFLLDLVDLEPDAVILYHAYNDLGPSLTPGFRPDYSHARRNLGEAYHLYRLRSHFPNLPSALYHYLLNSLFPGDISNSLLAAITSTPPDMDGAFQGTATYKRNLCHLLDVCRARGIQVLCSTYCQYLYPEVAASPAHLKYRKGLTMENHAMRELASEHGLPLVDTAGLMPLEKEYFVDSVHFSPAGMRRLASILADGLAEILDTIRKKRSGS